MRLPALVGTISMIQIPEPSWMKSMAGDSYLYASDVRNAFGINPDESVRRLIFQGAIPSPSDR